MNTNLDETRHVAEFWEALRRFLRRHEQIVRKQGLTPQRYQLLIMIKAAADQQSTVSELTERLHLAQNTVTELLDRAEQAGLITRQGSTADARVRYIHLTTDAEHRVQKIMEELRSDRALLEAVLAALTDHHHATNP